jgi:hypothetical protein
MIKFTFAIMAIGFLCPAWMALGDLTCWFWTGSQCSNLVWDNNRTFIACISACLALPCIGVLVS